MVTLPFANRLDAARELARALGKYGGLRPLVLAIPRGAVPMGRLIADALDGDLDLVMVKKIGRRKIPRSRSARWTNRAPCA